jgi:hypothetical protein
MLNTIFITQYALKHLLHEHTQIIQYRITEETSNYKKYPTVNTAINWDKEFPGQLNQKINQKSKVKG